LITLDHVAHFVPDKDAASTGLSRLGFTLTPFSVQSHRLSEGGPLVPAGTGNRLAMFERGYIEFLTPISETPNAAQLRAAMQRYIGVHLIAFGTDAPRRDYARLAQHAFQPLEPIALQRPISVESGEDTARFTVVRVPPGMMAEGRIQYCQHHTPELVWQKRWLAHANGATGLASVFVCVEDPDEAGERYARFSGLRATAAGTARRLETARGTLVFVDPAAIERTLGVRAPALPWIAGYALDCVSVAAARDAALHAGAAVRDLADGRLSVMLPDTLGGVVVFQAAERGILNFD
jgi:hypothetical protein